MGNVIKRAVIAIVALPVFVGCIALFVFMLQSPPAPSPQYEVAGRPGESVVPIDFREQDIRATGADKGGSFVSISGGQVTVEQFPSTATPDVPAPQPGQPMLDPVPALDPTPPSERSAQNDAQTSGAVEASGMADAAAIR